MQLVGQYSLFEEDKSVFNRILIVEVGAQGELLVKLNHRPVRNHTGTSPQPLMQYLHDILKPARDIIPLDAFLV